VLRLIAEKRIKRSLQAKEAGVDALREILHEMKEGGATSEFANQVREREKSRKQARAILTGIDKAARLSRKEFLSLYGELAGGLWYSGGLQRSKTRIANHPDVFQQIVRTAARHHTGDIAEIFESLRKLANQVPGIGPNILTEILQTYDGNRYAIMNQNSVAGMLLAGFRDFPETPNRQSVDGHLYKTFCQRAESIRQKLRLGDLSQLDAVFNYAYWRDQEKAGED